MSDDDVRTIVSETVAETLLKLGLDATDARELQADMIHLRRWRKSVEKASQQTLLTAIGILTAGVLGLIWLALRGGLK